MGFKSVIYNVYYLTHASLMDHETRGLASEVARRSPEPKVVLRRYYACASNCTVAPKQAPNLHFERAFANQRALSKKDTHCHFHVRDR